MNVYKTNLGLFVQQTDYPQHSKFKLDGILYELDLSKWTLFRDVQKFTTYEYLKKGTPKFVGYTLKISSVACTEIPLNLTPEDVKAYSDSDGDIVWKNYGEYQSLYKPVHEETPDVWESLPVEMTILREFNIDNYEDPIKMKVATVRPQTGWMPSNDLASVVHYQDIERLLTPEFLLHERPCYLTSEQVYSIVRNHIKLNINPKAAFVSSDYDFCFSVKRRIQIKPVIVRTEIRKQNGRSYATPRFNTKSVTSKDEIIFEMAPKVYNSYPVIEPWKADNLKDMAEQIKYYLDTLMEEINSEVEECANCGGKGCIVNKIGTNKREVVNGSN
ncbi:MAG TPA: hypothetical protein VIR31_03685 [Nitrososphaeraceae archaeon]